jgi:hypothetical protein
VQKNEKGRCERGVGVSGALLIEATFGTRRRALRPSLSLRLRAFGTIVTLLPKQDGVRIAPGDSEVGLGHRFAPVLEVTRVREAWRTQRVPLRRATWTQDIGRHRVRLLQRRSQTRIARAGGSHGRVFAVPRWQLSVEAGAPSESSTNHHRCAARANGRDRCREVHDEDDHGGWS